MNCHKGCFPLLSTSLTCNKGSSSGNKVSRFRKPFSFFLNRGLYKYAPVLLEIIDLHKMFTSSSHIIHVCIIWLFCFFFYTRNPSTVFEVCEVFKFVFWGLQWCQTLRCKLTENWNKSVLVGKYLCNLWFRTARRHVARGKKNLLQ